MDVLQNLRPRKILFHALPNSKAKSTLQVNSINTNDSTSVEHSSKTSAQNKFNTRQPIQNLTRLLPPKFYFLSKRFCSTDTFRSIRLSFRRLFRRLFLSSLSIKRAHIYIDKRSLDDKLLA